MIDKYIEKNGKRLRYGYTTGTCAAAAARAAVEKLFSGRDLRTVTVRTPKGWDVELEVHGIGMHDGSAVCHVIKDAGDDPDCTDRIRIFARAARAPEGITVTGGEGIGVVRKKGLQVRPGCHAINPVPMEMIRSQAKMGLPEGAGVHVEISAPEGVEIAKRTFNPRLGIEGGISILGTTGIVEPMSTEAMKDSLELKLPIIRATGSDSAVLVPGNYGRKFARESLGIGEEYIAETGNFVGFMLERALHHGMKEVLLVGHMGKLVKVAGGIFDTHSRVADARLEILAANCILAGGMLKRPGKSWGATPPRRPLNTLMTRHCTAPLPCRAAERCMAHVHSLMQVDTVIFSMEKGLLAMTDGAAALIERMGGRP